MTLEQMVSALNNNQPLVDPRIATLLAEIEDLKQQLEAERKRKEITLPPAAPAQSDSGGKEFLNREVIVTLGKYTGQTGICEWMGWTKPTDRFPSRFTARIRTERGIAWATPQQMRLVNG